MKERSQMCVSASAGLGMKETCFVAALCCGPTIFTFGHNFRSRTGFYCSSCCCCRLFFAAILEIIIGTNMNFNVAFSLHPSGNEKQPINSVSPLSFPRAIVSLILILHFFFHFNSSRCCYSSLAVARPDGPGTVDS